MEPLNRRYERKRISTICFGVAMLTLVSLAATVVLQLLAAAVAPSLAGDTEFYQWISSIGMYVLGYPVCWMIISRVPSDPMEKRKMTPFALPKLFAVSCTAMLGGSLLGYGVNMLISSSLGLTPMNPVEQSVTSSSLIFNIAVVVILAPIMEELIFRKAIIDRMNRLGDRPAIIVSALLFGLIHGNFYQFFYAFAVGLVFGYIYVRTGKIRYSITFHMLINLLFGILPTLLYQQYGSAASTVWEAIEVVVAVLGLLLVLGEGRKIRLLRGWVDLPNNRWASLAWFNFGMFCNLMVCAVMFILNLYV